MTRTGNTGMVVTNVKGAFHNNFFKIKYPEFINKDFLVSFLRLPLTQNKILKLAGTSTIPDLNHSDFYRMIFTFPTLPEQEKISSFFTVIDKKLNLLKEKKEKLELYKKGVMQQIFSQKLRFKDEKGNEFPEWEEKKLEEVLVKYEKKAEFHNQYPVLTSSRRGLFFQKDYYNGNDIASSDTTGYNIVPRAYFTYRHMSDDLIFKFNINNLCDKGIVSTLYPVFTTKNIYSEFLRIKLNEGEEFKKFAILQKQGGSRTYMYFSKLINLVINMPCEEEQKKIADFLSALDDKIALVDQQITQTGLWKKGLLQKMFV